MGTLVLIATPVGNLEDISQRALRELSTVDALACEDTRISRRIFERFELPSPGLLFSYHEHNEEAAGRRILGLLEEGKRVGVCSDGGYPGISDPGYRIIAAAIAARHEVDVVPGPSAVPLALLLSGLPTSSYTFKGFPPRKPGARKRFLEMERELPHTLLIFESPFRVAKLLGEAFEVLGDREAAVCAELTKKFQRVERGYLQDLYKLYTEKRCKGEYVIVIAGNKEKFFRVEDNDASVEME